MNDVLPPSTHAQFTPIPPFLPNSRDKNTETRELTHPPKMLRLTIRATDASVPPLLLTLMTDRLSGGTTPLPTTPRHDPSRNEISDAFANVMVEG